MTVKTQSGAIYQFTSKNGDLYFTKNGGISEYKVKCLTLEVGKPLLITAFALGMYDYKESTEITTFTSTAVNEIRL